MNDSDPAGKVSRDVMRVLASRRIGLAAALVVAAGGLSAGWVSLGIDHERLTYRYAGRDFRLTDVYGTVATKII